MGDRARFLVPLGPNGEADLPKHIKPIVTEIRGTMAEVVVTEAAAKYLRERRYASELYLPKSHISMSQVNTYMRCPLQYYWSYVKGLKIPPKSHTAYGTATHRMAEANFKQKLESATDLPVEHALEEWHNSFAAQKPIIDWEEGEDPNAIEQEGQQTVRLFIENLAPTIMPELVETEFTLEFSNTEFSVRGIIDIADTQKRIRDLKTTNRRPAADTAERDMQLTTYAIGYRALTGEVESGLAMDYFVRNKQQQLVTLEAGPRSDRLIERQLKTVAEISRAIRNSTFFPQPNNYMCKADKCGYWEVCQATW